MLNESDLHGYQQRAVDFILANRHAGCFIDLGLGKTVITYTALVRLIDLAEVEKVLVVAPKTVAETTWTEESAKWSHLSHLRVIRVMGTEKQRIRALQAKADIYVLGRDSFVWLVRYYKARLPFDTIVLDELTSFKSTTSQRFKAFRLIRAQPDRIIGLTGTPAPNGYLDLFGQLYCLDGGERLGKYKTKYIAAYFNTVTSSQGFILRASLKQGAKEEIEAKIADICISMKAEDYLQLPPYQEFARRVEFSPSLKKKYREFERELVLACGDQEITASSAAALANKLSQFSNGAVYDEDHMAHEIHSEKLQALREIVEAAQSSSSSVLVFYQYRHDIARISATLKDVANEIRVYEGEQDFRDWNAHRIDVLLAHPASCAYGLNLQEGGHIIVWYGTGWNAEQYEQANARLYRQGQKYPVIVYNLVCKDTVDERALLAIQNKIDAQQALMAAVKELRKKWL